MNFIILGYCLITVLASIETWINARLCIASRLARSRIHKSVMFWRNFQTLKACSYHGWGLRILCLFKLSGRTPPSLRHRGCLIPWVHSYFPSCGTANILQPNFLLLGSTENCGNVSKVHSDLVRSSYVQWSWRLRMLLSQQVRSIKAENRLYKIMANSSYFLRYYTTAGSVF
jgi:hypothetical protein